MAEDFFDTVPERKPGIDFFTGKGFIDWTAWGNTEHSFDELTEAGLTFENLE